MFEKIRNFAKKHGSKVLMGMGAVGIASQSHAAAVVDYTSLGTAVTAEIGPSITTVLPIAGTLLAVTVGWKLVRKFCK